MLERLRRLFGAQRPTCVVFFDERYPYEVRFEHTSAGLKRKASVNRHEVRVAASPTLRVWLTVSTSFAEISAPLLAEDCRHLAKVLHDFSSKAATYGGPAEGDADATLCGTCHQEGDPS